MVNNKRINMQVYNLFTITNSETLEISTIFPTIPIIVIMGIVNGL